MSAIVAVASCAEDPADVTWLGRATELSRAGAPHGHAVCWLGGAGLGHALLQTGGVLQGPLTRDERTWISADARLDARDDLRAALQAAGERPQSGDDDALLLLCAYRAWGERLLDHVSGDFAFVIWDAQAGRLLCARDQLGVIPLHYTRVGKHLLVASTIEALIAHPAVGDELDEEAVGDFLAFGYCTDPSASVYARIRQLPPAHRLVWTNGTTRLERYWSLEEHPPLQRLGSLAEGAAALRGRLDAAVADRLTAPRAATHLSGGLDSTSVAASAAEILRSRGAAPDALRAFTGVLGGASGDREGDFARLVAQRLGIDGEVVDATTCPPLDPFAPPPHRPPEPLPYMFTDFERRYAAVPAQHAPIALSGHGGDPLFGFAAWYWIEWLASGHPMRAARALVEPLRVERKRPHPGLRAALSALRTSRGGPPSLPPWLTPELHARTGLVDRWRARYTPAPLAAARRLDARGLAADPLWAAMFRSGDPNLTGIPVRFRYPLLDLRVLEFVLTLPPEPWRADKRLLREAARPRSPEQVLRRPKSPLVSTPAPGATRPRLEALTELVGRCDGLARFVDPAALTRDLLAGAEADADPVARRLRERALGLAHWLWHR